MTTPFDDLLPKLPEEVVLAAKECWKVCKGSKVGDVMSHIHHEEWLERLTEPIENRIRFILVYKASAERVERLRRLRPFDISKATPELREALTARNVFYKTSFSPEMLAVHAQVCGCPWGKDKNIFGNNII